MKDLFKDKKKLIAFIAIIVGVLVIAGVVLAVTLGKKPKKEEVVIPSSKAVATEPTTEALPDKETFAFFGIDTEGHTPVDINKSDIVMLMTLDHANKKIILTSVLRDSQVRMGDMGLQKLNVAYQVGGADFALQVLNDNFHTDLSDFLTLNWAGAVNLIDYIGGVDVEITDIEAETINSMVWMDLVGDGRNWNCQPVYGGYAHMDGTQAIHFSRIRKIDSDYSRAGRQQRTLQAIQSKINQMSADQYPELINTFFGAIVDTNIDPLRVTDWIAKGVKDYQIEGYVIPDVDYETDVAEGYDDTGAWVWIYDMENAATRVHSIVD